MTAFFAVDTTTEGIVSPQFTFKLAPNPASTELKLTAMQNILSVECYDLQGRCVASLKPSAPQCSLEVADWPRGIYMIKVYSGNAVAVRKLIVK